MAVIFRLARRYISRRLFQSVLFVVGVALGVAMVIAIDLANGSASRAFSLSTQSITGKATHQISGGPNGLPTDLYRQIRLDLGIRDSAPIVTDYVRAPQLGDQALTILGVDPFAEPPFRDYLSNVQLVGDSGGDGQAAFDAISDFIAQPNTVLISDTLANRFGVEAGDTITLRPAGGPVEVTVVGVLRPGDNLSAQALESLILTDIATAQDIVGQPGSLSRIDLILPDGYDLSQITALLPAGATLTTPSQSSGAVLQMTDAFELNLQALSLLALVVGVFLIYNTVTFSVVQRRPVIGILRALGTTRRQIFVLILGEALVLGLVGTVFGLGLGILFGRAAVGLVAQTISDLYFAVSVQSVIVDPFTLVKGAGIGLFASLAAATIPAIDATRTAPAGTLQRSTLEEQTVRLLPYITLGALGLVIAGVLLLAIPSQNLVLSFTALFAIIVGGAMFTPAILVLFMRLAQPLTERLFGLLGRLAPRSVTRSLSRTSIAVAALTVAVSVIVGITAMIGSFRNTVADWLETTLGADLYISPPGVTANQATGDVDAALVDVVAAVPGVAEVISTRQVTVTAPNYPNLPPVNLNSGTGETSEGRRAFAWLNIPPGYTDYFTALQQGDRYIVVSEPFAYRRNLNPQQNQLTLLTDQGEQTFTVIGVYFDFTTEQGAVFMADNVYRQYYDDPFISTLSVFVEPGADVDSVLADIQTGPLAGTELIGQDYQSLRGNALEVFDRTFAITYALQLLSVVVAFIGILSALMALQLEHTREYGVMRAVGLTPRQLWRYTLIQTGLMGTTAGVLALPIGMALAVVLIYVINVRSFGWTMQLGLPLSALVQSFAVAVLAALAAGIYPARKLGRLITARALRAE